MKKNYLLLAAFAMIFSGVNAQFTDDMESYAVGVPINDAGHWTIWADGFDGGVASTDFAHEGAQSYFVGADPTLIDPVLDLGNKIFGAWALEFWAYIPSGKEGYFNLQGEVPIGAGQWVVGNIFFNQDLAAPGEGLIDNSALGAVSFTFPHDEWFKIEMAWDINSGISLATWSMDVAGTNVIPAGTAFTDSAGTPANSLGGVNIYSISTDNAFYMDTMAYSDLLSTNDLEAKGLSVFPNPVQNVVNVQAQEAISSVAIYNVLGQQVYAAQVDALSTSIDMSSMASGAYFVKVNIDGQEGTVKLIK